MKFTKIVSRRRESDEIPSPRVAIRNFCLECMGYVITEVPLCTAPKCWLYPWRMGKTPESIKTPAQIAAGKRLNLRPMRAQ